MLLSLEFRAPSTYEVKRSPSTLELRHSSNKMTKHVPKIFYSYPLWWDASFAFWILDNLATRLW